MFGELLAQTRKSAPLIHCITNYVTVNDCANILLAAGASPIMADDAAEVEEITSLCGGLCINIGTLNSRTVEAMLAAGRKANACGRPSCSIRWARARLRSVRVRRSGCCAKSIFP